MTNSNTQSQYEKLEERIEVILVKLDKQRKQTNGRIFKNDELAKFLKVSKRTLQKFRDQKMIAYTQIGGVILYQEKDVYDCLNNHRIERKPM